jgi:hypothetical protein
MPRIKKTKQTTRKRTNRNLAIPAAAAAMPLNPKSAATNAIIKKIKAQRSILASFHLLRKESHQSTVARVFFT